VETQKVFKRVVNKRGLEAKTNGRKLRRINLEQCDFVVIHPADSEE
jgi:hypothetical protein